MRWKNDSSDLLSTNNETYCKVNKSCGPSRRTTSWTSTPDLTTLSDSVTSQVEQFKGNHTKSIIFVIIITPTYIEYVFVRKN